jgi:hypothetical protein
MCKVLGSGSVSRSAFKTSHATVSAFIKSNYFDIAKEIYKKTQEYNVPKKELVVEIDFYGDAPTLRNEIKVWLMSGFLDGSSVTDSPGWFRGCAQKKNLVRDLSNEYEQVTSDEMLAVCRSGNGMVTVLKSGDVVLLSDEAVESIGREDYVRMVACLGQPITNQYFEKRSGFE